MDEAVLNAIKKRPSTNRELAWSFNMSPNEMRKITNRLLRAGKIAGEKIPIGRNLAYVFTAIGQ